MMRRNARATDMVKLRKSLIKNRNQETIYTNSFAYIKILLIWIACIASDAVIGFRLELLYPLVLLLRSFYESVRVQGVAGSVHSRAFSTFFLVVIAATDFFVYILLPVQFVLFFASCNVWAYLLYQNQFVERSAGSPVHLLLLICMILFEYFWRYHGDSFFIFMKGSFVESIFNFFSGGEGASNWSRDAVSSCDPVKECNMNLQNNGQLSLSGFFSQIGSFLNFAFTQPSSFSMRVCRLLAAHIIGHRVIEVVGHGKKHLSCWRMEKRRDKVRRENEFYDRLLEEALGREAGAFDELAADNETAGWLFDPLFSFQNDYEPEFFPSSNGLALCAAVNSNNNIANGQRKISRTSGLSKQINGARQNSVNSKRLSVIDNDLNFQRSDLSALNSGDVFTANAPRLYLIRLAWYIIWGTISCLLSGLGVDTSSSSDSRIVLSSHDVDSEDDMMEHSSVHSQTESDYLISSANRLSAVNRSKKTKLSSSLGGSKTRGGRARGGWSRDSSFQQGIPASSALMNSSEGANLSSSLLGNNLSTTAEVVERQLSSGTYVSSLQSNGCIDASSDLDHRKEHYILLSEHEKLREELQSLHSQYTDLRYRSQQTESRLKSEIAQFKSKNEQLESKYGALNRQRENERIASQQVEKKLTDTQTRKAELERELVNEQKRNKQREEAAALRAVQAARLVECGEDCRIKKSELESAIRALQSDLADKERLITIREEEVEQIREASKTDKAHIEALKARNSNLDECLSKEARFKQDLFVSINETTSKNNELGSRLREKESEIESLRILLANNNIVEAPRSLSTAPPNFQQRSIASSNISRINPLVGNIASMRMQQTGADIGSLGEGLGNVGNSGYGRYPYLNPPADSFYYDGSALNPLQHLNVSSNSVSPTLSTGSESHHYVGDNRISSTTVSPTVRST